MEPSITNDEFETIPETVGGFDYSDLCWAYVEEDNKNVSKKQPIKEDFRTKQRRLQAEYTKALATLGIKSVTFHSMIYQGDPEKVSHKKILVV